MDKAARAALLTAKGMDKTSENIADYVADLLRQGRAKEVTDDLMEQADPQRLMHHYKSGNTGMDLPMDKASRMARAAQMGLTEDSLHGTAAGKDFSRFKGADRYGSRLGQENYVAPNTIDGRKLAAQFSTSDQGRVMPLLTPKPLDTSTLDDRLQFEKMMEDKNRMDDFRMKGGYRASGLPGWGDQWAIDTVNEAGVPAMKLHERDWVTSTAVFDPTKMRSQFARFDPRLDHLAHLSASTGGAMDFARHVEAVNRAGGQIAPSKYLPNVPRQVHANGGRENGKRDFTRDNPGGEWLEGKQARAAQYPHRKFIVGPTTGVIGGRSDMFLPTHILKGIAGLNDEVRTAGVHKYDSLLSDAQEGGFDHDQKGNKVVVAVNHYGQPYLLEGNTRVAVAHSLGIPKVKAEVRYWNGAENVDGPMHPDQVFGMASDSPDITKAAGDRIGKDYGGATGYVPQNWVQQQEVAMARAPRQAQQQQTSTLDTIAQLNELSKMGGTKPTAIAPSPSAALEGHPPAAGVSDAARAAFDALNKGWTGAPISVESAYRDPALNEAVGGAKGSQHLHGNAYDIDTSGWTPEAKLALATQAYNSGFRGFGFYDNNLHFDVGGQRAWGPSYHQDSIPDWAQDWTQQYVYANGGRVGKAGGGDVEGEEDGITAYHGSPHSFDQFDINKLGTGEGAQAYGHGLYFAGNEKIAKSYRDKLSMGASSIDGRPMADIAEEKYKLPYGQSPTIEHNIADIVSSYGDNARPVMQNRYPELLSAYDNMVSSGRISSGHMYKVKLNVKPHELLDWDKPLSEQHPNISDKINNVVRLTQSERERLPIRSVLELLGDPKTASEKLLGAGIKGIRYLDAGSRDLSDGDPTHNYVMFHHDPVQVVDKYEYGGTVGKEEGGTVEQMEQPANGMHMLRMRRAGINTKEDFWNRWRDRMKATAMPNSNLSAIGSKDSHFQQIDKLINFHRQDADANGIRSVLQSYGRIGPDGKKIHTFEDRNMAAALPKAILQGAGIEPTIDNASQIYHLLPDDESGRVGKAGGGEMDGVESNNQNGVSNVGTQNETGTAPFNPAPRAQAGELRDAGRVRGGSGVLQAPDEAPLEGLLTPVTIPMTGQVIHAAPAPHVRQVARDYMASTGLPYNPPKKYAKADPARALRISDAYAAMKDNSSDPLTKASYAAMIKETMAQYHAAKAAGFKAEFWDPQTQEDPYHASPRLATEDIKNNNHMFVFPTDSGYGSDGPITAEQIKTNPLLQASGETWNGIPVTVNDIFRAVHDYFGHAKEGVGFRADGEENAWRSHAAMYSPLARMAMTSETRGQNSWLNFNPVFGEKNRKARTENSTFADQKVGILPHWVHHEGVEDFMGPEEVNAMAAIRKVHGRATGGSVDAALALTRRFIKDGAGATLALKSKGK